MLGGLKANANVSITTHCRRDRAPWLIRVMGVVLLSASIVMVQAAARERMRDISIHKSEDMRNLGKEL
jgi:hypothetical protein